MKNKYDFRSDEEKLKDYNNSKIKASMEDMELDTLISNDMANIWHEVGGQGGMYDNFPIVRFYRGKGDEPHRAYALDGYGGVAIIAYTNKNRMYNRWKIVTLGEDDAFHFLNSRDLYCSYFGDKSNFLSIVSEAISILNNNI